MLVKGTGSAALETEMSRKLCEPGNIPHFYLFWQFYLKLVRAGVHATIKFSSGTMKWKHILHLILTGWEKWWFSESSFCDLEIKVNGSSHGRVELPLTLELFIELGFSGLEGLLGHWVPFYHLLKTLLPPHQKVLASLALKVLVIQDSLPLRDLFIFQMALIFRTR